MVQTRRITARREDTYGEEPLLEVARRRVTQEGGNLRLILRELREERKVRAQRLSLSAAPFAERLEGGTYKRVSTDPRWPFGVENELVIAPWGLSVCGLPRTVDPANNRNGPRMSSAAAKREARDIIVQKLERVGCDPILIMAEIAMDKENVKDEVRLRAAAELASMVYPRLRSVESTTREQKTVFVIGVPTEQPADAASWLRGAAGVKQIAGAVSEAIEGTAVEVRDVGTV